MINQKSFCTVPGCNYPAGQCCGACWSDDETRIDIIGQNGNDGLHYDAVPAEVDMVNHPPHYTAHASGVECIELTENLSFCLGNAVKYCFRAGSKNNSSEKEDLSKAVWYVERELARLSKRFAVRGEHAWQGEKRKNHAVEGTCRDKEWISDVAFCFAAKAALHTHHGSGNIRISAPFSNGRITLEWEPERQSTGKPGLGGKIGEYASESAAHDRSAGRAALVGKTDARGSAVDQKQQSFAVGGWENVWNIANTSESNTAWQKLAAFISAENDTNKTAAIFYLTTAENETSLQKALWYLKKLREVL